MNIVDLCLNLNIISRTQGLLVKTLGSFPRGRSSNTTVLKFLCIFFFKHSFPFFTTNRKINTRLPHFLEFSLCLPCYERDNAWSLKSIYNTYYLFQLLESKDEDYVRGGTNIIAILFLLVGVYTGVGIFFQIFIFNITGVRLTARLR